MTASILEISAALEFEKEVLRSDVPVLVDFSAPWCQPCKMMEPILDELADTQSGLLKVVKVDVGRGGAIATQYAVHSVPTLMLFVSADIVDRVSGYVSKNKLIGRLRNHVEGI